MRVVVIGGEIRTHGENTSAIQFGLFSFSGGAMTNVADVGEDGYRKHKATVNSEVFGGTGDTVGVYLWGWQGHHRTGWERGCRFRRGHSRDGRHRQPHAQTLC